MDNHEPFGGWQFNPLTVNVSCDLGGRPSVYLSECLFLSNVLSDGWDGMR